MNKLKIIDVEGLNIEWYYYFINAQGEQNETAKLFQRFVHNTSKRPTRFPDRSVKTLISGKFKMTNFMDK